MQWFGLCVGTRHGRLADHNSGVSGTDVVNTAHNINCSALAKRSLSDWMRWLGGQALPGHMQGDLGGPVKPVNLPDSHTVSLSLQRKKKTSSNGLCLWSSGKAAWRTTHVTWPNGQAPQNELGPSQGRHTDPHSCGGTVVKLLTSYKACPGTEEPCHGLDSRLHEGFMER